MSGIRIKVTNLDETVAKLETLRNDIIAASIRRGVSETVKDGAKTWKAGAPGRLKGAVRTRTRSAGGIVRGTVYLSREPDLGHNPHKRPASLVGRWLFGGYEHVGSHELIKYDSRDAAEALIEEIAEERIEAALDEGIRLSGLASSGDVGTTASAFIREAADHFDAVGIADYTDPLGEYVHPLDA